MRKFFSIIFVLLFLFHSISALGAEKIVILPFESLAKEDISFIQEVVPKLLSSRLASTSGREVEVISERGMLPGTAGKEFGAAFVITGTVTKIGGAYSLDIIAYDEAGKKAGGFFVTAQNENDILSSLESLGSEIAAGLLKVPIKTAGPADTSRVSSVDRPPKPVVDVKGAEFSSLEKLSNLGTVPSEIYRMASGDADGDGRREVACVGKNVLYLLSMEDGKLTELAAYVGGEGHHFLNVEFFDMNRDGIDEILVTDLVEGGPSSFVAKYVGGALIIGESDIPYFVGVAGGSGAEVVLGQEFNPGTVTPGQLFRITHAEGKLLRGEPLTIADLPKREVQVFSLDYVRSGSGGGFIFSDGRGRLMVTDLGGNALSGSEDIVSSWVDFILGNNIADFLSPLKTEIRGRIKALPGAESAYLIVGAMEAGGEENTVPGGYGKGYLSLVTWDGKQLAERTSIAEQGYIVTDFAYVRDGSDSSLMVVASAIEKFSTAVSSPKSSLFLYNVK